MHFIAVSWSPPSQNVIPFHKRFPLSFFHYWPFPTPWLICDNSVLPAPRYSLLFGMVRVPATKITFNVCKYFVLPGLFTDITLFPVCLAIYRVSRIQDCPIGVLPGQATGTNTGRGYHMPIGISTAASQHLLGWDTYPFAGRLSEPLYSTPFGTFVFPAVMLDAFGEELFCSNFLFVEIVTFD